MSIYITRLTPDTITGEGYKWDRLGYVEDDGWVVRRENGNTTRVGTVDRSGYVYDNEHNRVGRVDSDGDVYDEDHNRVAQLDSPFILDDDYNRVGYADEGSSRYSAGWLAKAAGAGYLLLILPEPERHQTWLREMGFR